MGSRSRTWFDSRMLLAGERFVRSATARLRTAAPPHWWEGELILTSDRLFFLPFAEFSPAVFQCRAGILLLSPYRPRPFPQVS